MDIPKEDLEHLVRDKYHGDRSADLREDYNRLLAGEPLAYVIGWIPFLGLRIGLDSRPLIPRPETEWWTELLVEHLKVRFGEASFRILDMCAGSGAVGLAVLAACPHARVSFGELHAEHSDLIAKNLRENNLDASRADIRTGDLLIPFVHDQFDIIVANPPYIPSERDLPKSVAEFEPEEALRAGHDGLAVITRLAEHAAHHLPQGGELWMECDSGHVREAAALLRENGAHRTIIRSDLYGRERLVLAYY
jgi:release factor glutamine methyltransferase